MIDSKGIKIQPFMEKLAQHLSGCGQGTAEFCPSEDVWYLAAGYWRAQVVTDEEGNWGVRLINPSRKASDIATIEAAMGILI